MYRARELLALRASGAHTCLHPVEVFPPLVCFVDTGFQQLILYWWFIQTIGELNAVNQRNWVSQALTESPVGLRILVLYT